MQVVFVYFIPYFLLSLHRVAFYETYQFCNQTLFSRRSNGPLTFIACGSKFKYNRITKQDVKMAVDKMKTGFNPPEDLPFEDLSNPSEATDSISPTSSKRFSRTDLQSRNSFTVGSIKTKKKTKLLNLFTGSKVCVSLFRLVKGMYVSVFRVIIKYI